MSASTLLLILGAAAVLGVFNAIRPLGALPFVLWSWPSAWVTVELAPHLVALGTVAGAVLVALGGLGQTPGVVGLAALVTADALAVPLIVRARRTVVDLGETVRDLAPADPASPYPRIHMVLPFLAWRRRGVRRVNGVVYARHGRQRLKLDIYMPSEGPASGRPAIVQVHGGGWVTGSRREQGIPLLGHLAANGWVGFNIDYRLSPRATFPDHIVDVKRAIAWVRQNAGDYGVDPSFIAVTGGSAGGHLSALAALTAGDMTLQPGFEHADTSVAACVPFYGVYDFLDPDRQHLPLLTRVVERWVFKASRRKAPERFRDASPQHRIHAGAPPFFVIHGAGDSLIDAAQARRFSDTLRETSRAPVLYAEMRGGQHAFDVIPSWRTVPVIEAIERFLATARNQGAAGEEVKAALTD